MFTSLELALIILSVEFALLALGLTFPVVITVNYFGDPDNGVIFSGYVGSLMLAGSYLAVSCMTSALTRNQVISFILSVMICLFLILAGYTPVTDLLTRFASPVVVDIIAAFSVMTHFEGFQRGVLDTRDVVFFASVIGFMLFTDDEGRRGHRQRYLIKAVELAAVGQIGERQQFRVAGVA